MVRYLDTDRAMRLQRTSEATYGHISMTEDEETVECLHCGDLIPCGSDYAVILYFPDDKEKKNPFGPYCKGCLPKVKLCSKCNKAHFGANIEYKGDGIYLCKGCEV